MGDYYNTIVMTNEEFGTNLYTELGRLLMILFKAGYVCVVREEETGIVRIDFNYDVFNHFGNPIPVWLTEDEMYNLVQDELDDTCCCGKCHDND